jgi:hypothetical protein
MLSTLNPAISVINLSFDKLPKFHSVLRLLEHLKVSTERLLKQESEIVHLPDADISYLSSTIASCADDVRQTCELVDKHTSIFGGIFADREVKDKLYIIQTSLTAYTNGIDRVLSSLGNDNLSKGSSPRPGQSADPRASSSNGSFDGSPPVNVGQVSTSKPADGSHFELPRLGSAASVPAAPTGSGYGNQYTPYASPNMYSPALNPLNPTRVYSRPSPSQNQNNFDPNQRAWSQPYPLPAIPQRSFNQTPPQTSHDPIPPRTESLPQQPHLYHTQSGMNQYIRAQLH